MRYRAAQEGGFEHAFQPDVGQVLATTIEEALILHPEHAGPQSLEAHRPVSVVAAREMVGRHLSSQSVFPTR